MNSSDSRKSDFFWGLVIAFVQAVLACVVAMMLSGISGVGFREISIESAMYCTLLLFSHNVVMMVFAKKEIKRKFVKYFVVLQTLLLLAIVFSELLGIYVSPYLAPYIAFGLAVSSLISKQLALYVNALVGMEIIIVGFMIHGFVPDIFVKAIVTVLGGGLLILIAQKSDSRIKTIANAVIVSPIYVIIYLVSAQMLLPNSGGYAENMVAVAGNPVIAVFFVIGVLPVFEWCFKILTAYRIVELGDVSKGLLRELSEKAKGTFHHSMAVANLTAACAVAIGEDSQLARVCALFHDVGKLSEPVLFSENQTEESGNPHDKMTPELSVALIRKHTRDGAQMLKERRVPSVFVDCAIQHHGTLPIRVFYERAKKFSDGEVNMADYSYDGEKPTNKISAMIMICDASEAAVRARGCYEAEAVDDVVKGIIEERIILEQFDNCPLTLKDLHVIRETIVNSFVGIMHKRVKYPKFSLK